jgi:hypothetical protein
MTRKDYIAIAKTIADERPYILRENKLLDREVSATLDSVAMNLAEMLQRDNPRFDRDKFLTACGVQS